MIVIYECTIIIFLQEHTDLKIINLSNNGFGDNAGPHLRRMICKFTITDFVFI